MPVRTVYRSYVLALRHAFEHALVNYVIEYDTPCRRLTLFHWFTYGVYLLSCIVDIMHS